MNQLDIFLNLIEPFQLDKILNETDYSYFIITIKNFLAQINNPQINQTIQNIEQIPDDKLVNTALQVYARACSPLCSQDMHNAAIEYKNEILKRLSKIKKE